MALLLYRRKRDEGWRGKTAKYETRSMACRTARHKHSLCPLFQTERRIMLTHRVKYNMFILPLPITVVRAVDPGSLFVTHRHKCCIEFSSWQLCFVFAPQEFHLQWRRVSRGNKNAPEQLAHWRLIKWNNTDIPVQSNFTIINQIS